MVARTVFVQEKLLSCEAE